MNLYSKITNNQPALPETHNQPKFQKNTQVEIDGQTLTVQRFDKWSDEKKKQAGYYPYEHPSFDPILEKLGDLYFDHEREVVTRHIITKQLDITVEKEKKIWHLQQYVTSLLSLTDSYYTRLKERQKPVPIEIQDERAFIHDECDRMKNEINELSNVKDVITYECKISGLNYHN